MIRFIHFFVAASLCLTPGPGYPQTDVLPDIGSPWESTLSQSESYRIGRVIVHQLRQAGELLEDPEVTEYVQALGHRISSHAHEGDYRFQFFVVDDPSINAFALPGGFIGVNLGLILATADESELAGVLAHEIAHVTQEHIARLVQSQGATGLAATAAMIAAILLGAAAGADGNAIQAAVAVAQGYAAQKGVEHTRRHEYEADRFGVGILADSGFDPLGMPRFFETMARRSGISATQVPEFLRTHPVESNRIAESMNRAVKYGEVEVTDSTNYRLMRARLRVMNAETASGAVGEFEALAKGDIRDAPAHIRYGYATALLQAGDPERAEVFFDQLQREHPDITVYHIGLGQAQFAAGKHEAALDTLGRAQALSPRNIPLTMRYSRALMDAQLPKEAHELMLDLLNNIAYTPEQLRLIALAANAAGDTGDAYYYMSEFHVQSGDLRMAVRQLELALAAPQLQDIQRARFKARMEDIAKYVPQNSRRSRSRDEDSQLSAGARHTRP